VKRSLFAPPPFISPVAVEFLNPNSIFRPHKKSQKSNPTTVVFPTEVFINELSQIKLIPAAELFVWYCPVHLNTAVTIAICHKIIKQF
jgi:hypothetical protein